MITWSQTLILVAAYVDPGNQATETHQNKVVAVVAVGAIVEGVTMLGPSRAGRIHPHTTFFSDKMG
jgi:hypothetical protein